MSGQMPFIGREKELAEIKRLIEEEGTRRVLCINGVGGIGKTRLLTEIYHQYAGNPHNYLLVTNILDFDNRVLHLPENLERQIAQQLDEATFEPYLRNLLDWRKMEAVGVSREGLEKQSQRVRQMFIACFNHLAQAHRIALLLDTTEKLEDEEVWERLISVMEASQNTIFLLAGRNAKEVWERLTTSSIGDNARLLDLQPFDDKVGAQYLEQKDRGLGIHIETELKKKLLLLSGGRPILLDLAVEWLTREQPLTWMIEKSLDELLGLTEVQLTPYKEEFERRLVRHIIQIVEPIDRLTLVMSRIYPLSPKMIAKLLNLSPTDSNHLFDEAQTYVFIKSLPDTRITLHDEMRRMVEVYVWPDAYPVGRRRRDSRRAAELFEEEDKLLREKLTERETGDLGGLFEQAVLTRTRDIIHQQWIEHSLYSEVESGFMVWKKIVDQRRIKKEFRFAYGLIELAELYYDQFDFEQKFTFDMLKVRLTNDTGQVREAERMLHYLLDKNINNRKRKADIYNVLAQVEAKLGKLKEARAHQLECLNIVTDTNPKFVGPVANLVGNYHERLGELKKAETYYKLALGSTDKGNKRLIAGLLNNLGYVYGLQIRYRQMELYCRQAIQIWSEIGADREIGRAENTMAIFSRVQGRYDEAIELLERAISRYKEPDDHEKLTRAYLHLGWTQWYKAENVDDEAEDIRLLEWDETQLEQARYSLDKSRALAERYGLEAQLPNILHLNALVYWYLGRVRHDNLLLNRGRELNTASYKKSKQVGDIQYAVACLLADAEWDYEIEKYDQIDSYAKELNQYDPTPYPLYFGRMRRIEADIAFYNGELEKAFSKYALGLSLIHRHGGFGQYAIQRELLRLENKMIELSTTEWKKWAEYLHQKWLQINDQDTHLLTAWSEQQILRADMSTI